MTERIQFKRQKGWRKPDNCVMVCRPSRFGNPRNWKNASKHLNDYQKKYAVKRDFEEWLLHNWSNELPKRRQWILDNLDKIRDADYIACYCGPDDPCHGDVLIELANDLQA